MNNQDESPRTTAGNRIADAFQRAKSQDRLAFLPYISAGYPNAELFESHLEKLISKADLLEIGLPFSDPLADGPTIQRVNYDILCQGFDPFEFWQSHVDKFRQSPAPVMIMAYANTLLDLAQRGFDDWLSVDGLIVPDLPWEEQQRLRRWCGFPDQLPFIQILTPNMPVDRCQMISGQAAGFIYLTTAIGVTGKSYLFDERIGLQIERIRESTDLPLVLGFGIRQPQQVQPYRQLADGFVVGSALLDAIAEDVDLESWLEGFRHAD